MRTLLVFALLAQLVVVPDAIQKDTLRIERDGLKQGEIRRDVLNRDQLRMYDSKALVGTWKRDVILRDRYRFEETR